MRSLRAASLLEVSVGPAAFPPPMVINDRLKTRGTDGKDTRDEAANRIHMDAPNTAIIIIATSPLDLTLSLSLGLF
jgi:hypothetical protein